MKQQNITPTINTITEKMEHTESIIYINNKGANSDNGGEGYILCRINVYLTPEQIQNGQTLNINIKGDEQTITVKEADNG